LPKLISSLLHVNNKPSLPWIWLLLGLHVGVWVLAHGITDTNLDGYADMLENYAWGQTFEWGSAKHPPLFAWVTGVWFAVFPTVDAAYHLLSYANAALGLLGVYRVSQAIGREDLALPSALLLCMAFPYSTLAVKFNANAILLSLWPWVALAWVHSILRQGRRAWWWTLGLGVLSALAMLAKYYSGVFLLGIFLTTLVNQDSRLWFKTPKPWVALLVFAVCLLPHVQWLAAHDFVTLHYVSEQGGADGTSWGLVAKFAISPVAYWLLPWLLCTWFVAPGKLSFKQRALTWPTRMWRSWCPQGWDDSLFWFAMLPWAITLVFGITGFVELSLPWAIPIGYGFSLLWLRNLSADGADLNRVASRLRLSVGVWLLLVLAISPWYAWYQAQNGTENHYLPRREAAREVLKGWQERHPDVPLKWVGGQWAENALVAFYGNHRLRVVSGVPDQFPATVTPLVGWQQQAGVMLCPLGPVDRLEDNTLCAEQMASWLFKQGQTQDPIEFRVKSEGLRFPLDKPFAYLVFDYLPRPAK
jgi:4-amino-4-deoxy-L-arabinose transferase-like glycosyltransferase